MNAPVSKGRAIAIIVSVLIVVYMGASSLLKPNNSKANLSTTNVDSAPPITSVPGSPDQGSNNARYQQMQVEANEKRAKEATKTGQSAVPTLVNKYSQEDKDFFDEARAKQKESEEKAQRSRDDMLKKAQEDAKRRLEEQQQRLDALRKEQEEKRAAADRARLAQQHSADRKKNIEELAGLMRQDMNSIVTQQYANVTKQSYVSSSKNSDSFDNQINALKNKNSGNSVKLPLYRAGEIIYGVVETYINTDEPGPVLARISLGPLKGAILLGTLQALPSTWAQGAVLQFTSITPPYAGKSQAITAIAVDPDTARTALATTIDNHYVQRYGAMFTSKLLEGYSQAIQQSGTTTTTQSDGTTITSSPEMTDSDKVFVAIGNVATALGSSIGQIFNRPTTITVEPGTAIGLLIMQDFTLE